MSFMERVLEPQKWTTTEPSATARLERWLRSQRGSYVSWMSVGADTVSVELKYYAASWKKAAGTGATLDAAIHAALDAAGAAK